MNIKNKKIITNIDLKTGVFEYAGFSEKYSGARPCNAV